MAFAFLKYFFSTLEIFTFLYYANEESDDLITIKQWNTETRTSPEILEQCSSNLAPEKYITKETKWHLLCCCHGNTLGSSLFLWKSNCPHLQRLQVEQSVFLGTHNSHILLTPPISMLGVDDPSLRWNLGIFALIKTEPMG